jgi:hypothetical protein
LATTIETFYFHIVYYSVLIDRRKTGGFGGELESLSEQKTGGFGGELESLPEQKTGGFGGDLESFRTENRRFWG